MMEAPALLDELEKALAAGDLAGARALSAQLRRTGGTAALQLAAEVLHEVRQPLLGVKAYAQLLSEGSGADSVAAQLLTQIERMESIIGDFTRLAADKPAPQALLDLAQHARLAQRQFLPRTDPSRLSVELVADVGVEVQGNGRLLGQLMLNLLGNAGEAMGGAGRLKVVVTREGGRPALYVADWGPGIPAELRPRIFEPYLTSKGRGSGLGLAVCRRIAQEHGAVLELAPPSSLPDSPPPSTVFRLLFPAEPRGPAAPPASSKRLLVVDDEPIIRAVLLELMGKECEVAEAENAEQALEHLRKGAFDLVMTDKNLPGRSGLEVVGEARRLHPSVRVILMTGYPSLASAQQALELGATDYLVKPFDEIKAVRERVRAALARPAPAEHRPANKRVEVIEDNPSAGKAICEALTLIGLEPRAGAGRPPGPEAAPAAVVVSWDLSAAHGASAIALAMALARGAPVVVLAENPTLESALEAMRGGAIACLPKRVADTSELARELSRALKVRSP